MGPRQSGRYGMVVPRFVQQALNGQPLTVYGDGQQTRCFCDVTDAVRAIIGLGEEPRAVGEVFNIGSTAELSILDLARRVLREVEAVRPPGASPGPPRGDNNRIVFVPYDEAYEAGFEDMRRRVPDTTKVQTLLGWQPQISLRETLRRVIGFYTSQ
jgi:UDP-glucose 4-epimerase